MNKFHQNMNKCNINFYKGKHKLEGAQTVEYKKEDVLDTWKSLSLSKRREYFFFIDKVLVNKINDVNKHLRKSAIESQITKETVWKIASSKYIYIYIYIDIYIYRFHNEAQQHRKHASNLRR